MHLDNVSISREITTSTKGNVFFTLVLGESPFQGLQNLLATSKLEFSTTDGLDDVSLVCILGTDGEQDLSNVDTGSHANRLSVRVAHTTRQAIGTGTTQHFVGTEDVKGVCTDTDVEGFLSNVLDQVLVDSNAACFQGFRGDLLFFIAHKVGNKGEEIDGSLLGTRIKNTNL